MVDELREVTVNGVRFLRADDVERWHRQLVRRAEIYDEAEERAAQLTEFLQHTLDEYAERMPSQWTAHARSVLA